MKNAFTLIELIIVVAIISIVAGFTIASLNSQSSQKALQKEAEKLVNILNLAEKKASAGNTCSRFKGYRVTLNVVGYTLERYCDTAYTAEGTYSFDSSVVLSTSPTNSTGTVFFNVLSAGALLDNTASKTTKSIYVKNPAISGTSQCILITVESTGRVSMTDAISTCN